MREHPACYFDRAELLIPAIQENPWLLKTPIVRNGNKITSGIPAGQMGNLGISRTGIVDFSGQRMV